MSPKPETEPGRDARLMQVVGARPQFVKVAPVCRAIDAANVRGARIASLTVHTGQHYDPSMSDVFFEDLAIPRADIHLGVGSGTHGQQTGRMIEKLETVFEAHRPDIVLTYGDTNSTLAATLAAAKLHLPIAHVEAGLRSFDRRMPEEINRLVADQLSELLFAPTPEAMRNLAKEGLGARARLVGDVMLDAIRFHEAQARSRSRILEELGLTAGAYLVATVHRAANTDGPVLADLVAALSGIGSPERPVVFPVHPRTAKRLRDQRAELPHQGLRLVEPLRYLDMIRLVADAHMVLTDSGGLQKEAFFLGSPCITLRNETEWVETVKAGGNVVAGAEPAAIHAAVAHWDRLLSAGRPDFSAAIAQGFGDGSAATRIVAEILSSLRPVSRG